MTHLEMRKKERKRQERIRLLVLIILCIVCFLWGMMTYRCICRLTHKNTQESGATLSSTYYCTHESVEDVEYIETEVEEAEPIVGEPEIVQVEEEPVEEEPVEEEFVSYYTYTEEELDLLARLIQAEGGAESYKNKLKIGSVVMNRVDYDKFPNTIREVIYAKNQFSVTTIKINGVIMIDRPASEDSIRAAKEILDYGSILPPDVLVFYDEGVEGNWVNTREVYEISDGTVFAYIYPKEGES